MSGAPNNRVSGAASGAAQGASIGGGWGALAGAVIGAVTAPKNAPSVLQGFDVQGTFGPRGFQGEVWGFDQKGNRWIGTGETSYINSLGIDLISPTFTLSPLEAPLIEQFKAENINIPVSLKLPADTPKLIGSTGTAIADHIRQLLNTRASSPLDLKTALDKAIANGIAPASTLTNVSTSDPSSKLLHGAAAVASLIALFFLLRKGF